MKKALIASAALMFGVVPAFASLREGNPDLPSTTPVVQEVGAGIRCLTTEFPGGLKMVELVHGHMTIAAGIYMRGEMTSALEPELLTKHCGKL